MGLLECILVGWVYDSSTPYYNADAGANASAEAFDQTPLPASVAIAAVNPAADDNNTAAAAAGGGDTASGIAAYAPAARGWLCVGRLQQEIAVATGQVRW